MTFALAVPMLMELGCLLHDHDYPTQIQFHNQALPAFSQPFYVARPNAQQPITFVDKTSSFPGLEDHRGHTYGLAWGNLNGDIQPDLYVNQHYSSVPSFYISSSDGFSLYQETRLGKDRHGAAFADLDNDGDDDLIELAGGAAGGQGNISPQGQGNRLLRNDAGNLTDIATIDDVMYTPSRGRTPLWFDQDLDGDLDLYTGAINRNDGQYPSQFFRNKNGVLQIDHDGVEAIEGSSWNTTYLSDLDGDGELELIAKRASVLDVLTKSPDGKYERSDNPRLAMPLPGNFGTGQFDDAVFADFNNDLRPDVWLATGYIGTSVSQFASGAIRAETQLKNEQFEMSFNTSGNVTFHFDLAGKLKAEDIFIGSGAVNPQTTRDNVFSQGDRSIYGKPNPEPDLLGDHYMLVWRANSGLWKVEIHAGSNRGTARSMVFSTERISNFSHNAPEIDPPQDALLINTQAGFVDRSHRADLIVNKRSHYSVMSGDFDNDMDIDVVALQGTKSSAFAHSFYENDGTGRFTRHDFEDLGVPAPLGASFSAAIADYNVDGFLDIISSNGVSHHYWSVDGSYQVAENQGNANNWVQIDLEGVQNNRDGIGAKVLLTAGGLTQMRELTGGVHNHAQDHKRLHFGLAGNQSIDNIEVRWPDGFTQKISGPLSVNRVLRIVEDRNEPIAMGDIQNTPSKDGVYIMKLDESGNYKIRVRGDDDLSYKVEVLSERKIKNVAQDWSSTAQLSYTTRHIDYLVNQDAGDHGFLFKINPSAKTLISVEKNGVPNARDVHFGTTVIQRPAKGWILDPETLSQIDHEASLNLGLSAGQTEQGDVNLSVRGSKTGNKAEVSVLSNKMLSSPSLVKGEVDDRISSTWNSVSANLQLYEGVDQIQFGVRPDARLGLTYKMDQLWEGQANWHPRAGLGSPNAYILNTGD